MQVLARWLGALLLFVTAAAAAQGEGFIRLNPAQPTATEDRVEVREFFSYACPHCFTFKPRLEAWLKQTSEPVTFVRTPVVFHETWRPLAQAYYAAETLDVLDKIHQPLFEAIHVKQRRFRSADDLIAFFAEQGVPRERAAETFASFRVDMLMRQGAQALRSYRIQSTPTVVVNGKYVVTPNTAGGQERMIEVIDRLVRREAAAWK